MSHPGWHIPIADLSAGRRLILCAIMGAVACLLGGLALKLSLSLALGWVVGVALFLGLTVLAVGGAPTAVLRGRARQQDERVWVVFAILIFSAAVSLLAVGVVLRPDGTVGPLVTAFRTILAGLAVTASWLLMHATFGLRYAHLYYGDDRPDVEYDRGGLSFPGNEEPDYWDFFYYAFVVGMTCQVSDVQVTSRLMRRLTLAHGALSFFFNTVILALAVNFVASTL